MLTNREELDRLFHDKLSDFSPNPPQYLWDNIEMRLNSRKRGSYRLKMIGAAAAVLVLFVTGWWYHPFTSQHPYVITENSMGLENHSQSTQNIPEIKKNSDQWKLERKQIPSSDDQISNIKTEPGVRILQTKHSFQNKQDQQTFTKKPTDKFATDLNIISGKSRMIHKDEKLTFNSRSAEPESIPFSHSIPKNKISPWSIEIKASPFFTSSLEKMESSDEQTFSAGILAGYKLSKRVSINSGLLVNSISRKTKVMNLDILNHPNNTETPAQIQEKYRYCEIPVTLNYKVIDRKLKVGLSGGLSANILASEKANINTSGEIKATSLGNLPDVTYAGMIGLEIGYQVSKKITVTIEPLIKHYLNSSADKSDLKLQSLQAGLYTGVRYSFN